MRKRILLTIALVSLASPCFAQRITATIRGTVTDTSGAVVPGASVTVTNENTGFSRSTVTNDVGSYSFVELPHGTYTIDVSLSGFKSAVRKGIVLDVADVRGEDVRLEAGTLTETVTVQSRALAVQTIGGEVAGLVTGEQVREMPLNGRNFLQLGTLMPGVSQGDTFNTKDRGLMSGIELAVSGSSLGGNLWMVDGANNNDVGSNRTILVFPSVDAIDEFKVHRNSYGAEFGGAAGAQVNIVTRSGTNDYHGSGYYFGRNDALAARDYFLEQANQPKAALSVHDFGGTIGGPIIKDKLQFFASEEWNREERGVTRTAFVPTAAERAGDFSGPLIEGCSSDRPIDPVNGKAFSANRIPQNRLSPAGLLVMQLYPLPNTTPSEGSCNNWVTSLNTPINWRQDHARVDYAINNHARVMVRYTQDSWTNNSPSAEETLWGDDPFPAVDSNWEQPGRSFTAQLTQNIGSAAVNALTFSYSANVISVTRGGLNAQLNDQINAAIPGMFPDSQKEYGANRGHPIFFGRESYGDDLQNMAPFKNNQNLFVVKDDYSRIFGNHLVKLGIVASYNQKNEDVFDQGSAESSQFGDAVGLTGDADTTGNPIADLLLKGMAFDFSEARAERAIQQRWRDVEAYASDSLKLSHVTIDYGFRWSRFENPYDVGDTISSFDPATFNAALGADACNGMLLPPGSSACKQAGLRGGTDGPNRTLADSLNGFAPRLGVAWDVNGDGRTSLRAGLGRFYQRESLQNGLNLGFNPPFNRVLVGSRTLDSNAEPFPDAFATTDGIPQYGLDSHSGKMGYNWQWNVTAQREIVSNTRIEVGYVGSKGVDLLHPYDVNQVPLGDHNGNGVQDRLDYIRAGGNTAARAALRPYNVFGNSSIAILDHSGRTMYHSLQTQIVSHFGRGSQFQASYTLSRTTGDVTLIGGENGVGASAVSLNENRELDEGHTFTDRPHIFNASLVLALPDLEGRSAGVRNVLGGWEVATIVQASSGRALTVFTGAIPGLPGRVSGTGLNANQRPNLVDGQDCRASSGPQEQWLNPGKYTLAGFQLGTFGNSPRGVCYGPDFFQTDLALYKNVRVNGRFRAQLRFEVFNVFNRTNFIGVNTGLNPSSVTLDAPRATATRIVAFTPSGSFGQATATRDPRQAQFGLKLTF